MATEGGILVHRCRRRKPGMKLGRLQGLDEKLTKKYEERSNVTHEELV